MKSTDWAIFRPFINVVRRVSIPFGFTAFPSMSRLSVALCWAEEQVFHNALNLSTLPTRNTWWSEEYLTGVFWLACQTLGKG